MHAPEQAGTINDRKQSQCCKIFHFLHLYLCTKAVLKDLIDTPGAALGSAHLSAQGGPGRRAALQVLPALQVLRQNEQTLSTLLL